MANSIYEDLEDGVITALAPMAIGGNVDVVLFPDDESQYKKPFSIPRITVRYHSFAATDPLSVSTSDITKGHSVQIIFEAKKTRGPLGIFDLQCQAELLLNGLKLPNYKQFTLGTFIYSERDATTGVWTYDLIIKTDGASNQVIDNITPRNVIPGLPQRFQ